MGVQIDVVMLMIVGVYEGTRMMVFRKLKVNLGRNSESRRATFMSYYCPSCWPFHVTYSRALVFPHFVVVIP